MGCGMRDPRCEGHNRRSESAQGMVRRRNHGRDPARNSPADAHAGRRRLRRPRAPPRLGLGIPPAARPLRRRPLSAHDPVRPAHELSRRRRGDLASALRPRPGPSGARGPRRRGVGRRRRAGRGMGAGRARGRSDRARGPARPARRGSGRRRRRRALPRGLPRSRSLVAVRAHRSARGRVLLRASLRRPLSPQPRATRGARGGGARRRGRGRPRAGGPDLAGSDLLGGDRRPRPRRGVDAGRKAEPAGRRARPRPRRRTHGRRDRGVARLARASTDVRLVRLLPAALSCGAPRRRRGAGSRHPRAAA